MEDHTRTIEAILNRIAIIRETQELLNCELVDLTKHLTYHHSQIGAVLSRLDDSAI
jgi:hypothetical protein